MQHSEPQHEPTAQEPPSLSHGVAWHVPWQKGVAPLHCTPQLPQLVGSLTGFTHSPAQQLRSGPHAGLQDPLALPPAPVMLTPPAPVSPPVPVAPAAASLVLGEVVSVPPHAPMINAENNNVAFGSRWSREDRGCQST